MELQCQKGGNYVSFSVVLVLPLFRFGGSLWVAVGFSVLPRVASSLLGVGWWLRWSVVASVASAFLWARFVRFGVPWVVGVRSCFVGSCASSFGVRLVCLSCRGFSVGWRCLLGVGVLVACAA